LQNKTGRGPSTDENCLGAVRATCLPDQGWLPYWLLDRISNHNLSHTDCRGCSIPRGTDAAGKNWVRYYPHYFSPSLAKPVKKRSLFPMHFNPAIFSPSQSSDCYHFLAGAPLVLRAQREKEAEKHSVPGLPQEPGCHNLHTSPNAQRVSGLQKALGRPALSASQWACCACVSDTINDDKVVHR
jgi:hypothetical protein